jgi:hypothetical protein
MTSSWESRPFSGSEALAIRSRRMACRVHGRDHVVKQRDGPRAGPAIAQIVTESQVGRLPVAPDPTGDLQAAQSPTRVTRQQPLSPSDRSSLDGCLPEHRLWWSRFHADPRHFFSPSPFPDEFEETGRSHLTYRPDKMQASVRILTELPPKSPIMRS